MKNVKCFYKKVGRRYIPIGPLENNWFPQDGIWLVQIKPNCTSQECVLQLGELPSLYPYANMTLDKAELVKLFMSELHWCADTLATLVLKWLAQKEIERNKRRIHAL